MKKAIIVTVYNTENCGSFLQAYAMKTVLERVGYEVAFYYSPVGAITHRLGDHIVQAVKNTAKGKFIVAKNTVGRYFAFEHATKDFKIVTHNSNFYNEAELVVLGSDTIWNFNSPNFTREVALYWGALFPGKKVISYAASAGNTSEELFKKVINGCKPQTNISRFLVRDCATQGLLSSIGINESSLVCDPTLLLRPKDYRDYIGKYPHKQKCFLIYSFADIASDIRKEIISYARKHNLVIVSLIKYFKWADSNPVTSPTNLITYFSNAEVVVTDTFHGTAYSLNYGVPFAVIERDKIKVHELLELCSETKRLFSKPEALCNTLDNRKFTDTQFIIESLRTKSLKLLTEAIEQL